MAQVRLHLYEASRDGLPRVCLRCGQPALRLQTLQISWFPPWVNWLMLLGLIPYLIVSPMLTKKAVLHAPFCPQHENHWRRRGEVISVSILAVVFAMGLSMGWYRPLFPVVLFVFFPAAIAFVTWVHRSSVRPTEVTNTHLVIDGVCDEFVEALVRRDQAIALDDDLYDAPLQPPIVSDAIQIPVRPMPPSNAIEE